MLLKYRFNYRICGDKNHMSVFQRADTVKSITDLVIRKEKKISILLSFIYFLHKLI